MITVRDKSSPDQPRLAGTQPVIRLRNAHKVYYTDDVETHALTDVTLDVHPGEFLAIAGPSGGGKTTLLSILGLLDSLTSGSYELEGRETCMFDATERALVRNRRIGFVFQAFNLIDELTVRENVELPLTYGDVPRNDARARAIAALERMGMSHRQNHFPSQLSGGQQQRVAIARAVVGDPALLLADEPTGNLDSSNGEAVMELLQEMNRAGATICMVTHDHRYVRYASRTIQLFDGRVVAEGRAHADRALEMAGR